MNVFILLTRLNSVCMETLTVNQLVKCSVCLSAGEGSGDHQILPYAVQTRRLGLGAELRHHRSQQPLVSAALHRQRQLRPDVSDLSPP